MAYAKGYIFKEGDTPLAFQLNYPYTNVAGVSIDGDNTGSKWAIKKHFSDNPTHPINELSGFRTGTSSFTTSSTNYVVVEMGGVVPIETIVGNTMNTTGVVRVEWDALIGEEISTVGVPSIPENSYKFRATVICNGGSKLVHCAYGQYGFTGMTGYPEQNNGTLKNINWRSCAGTDIVLLNPTDDIDSVVLEVKVFSASSVINIERASINCVVVRN